MQNSTFFATSVRKSEEILSRLAFSSESFMDEFHLHKYKNLFEGLLNAGKWDTSDVIALSLVYFNLKKFDEFEELLNTRWTYDKNIEYLKTLYLGKIAKSEFEGNLEIKSFLSEYFDRVEDYSREQIQFSLNRRASSIFYTKRIDLNKHIDFNISFINPDSCIVTCGPYVFEEETKILELMKMDIGSFLIQEFSKDVVFGRHSDVKMKYLREYLPQDLIEHVINISTPKLISA